MQVLRHLGMQVLTHMRLCTNKVLCGRAQNITTVVTVSIPGVMTISPIPIRADGTVTVTVTDPDANRQTTRSDSFFIMGAVEGLNGDSTTVPMQETDVNSGVFTGSVRIFSSAPPLNGDAGLGGAAALFSAGFKSALVFTYHDENPSQTIQARGEVLDSAPAQVILPASFRAGGTLAIRVIDPDLNDRTPLTVSVRAECGASFVDVALKKLSPLSTEYIGTLSTYSAGETGAENSLIVSAGAQVRLFRSWSVHTRIFGQLLHAFDVLIFVWHHVVMHNSDDITTYQTACHTLKH
jgi:hypothetical protein